MRVLSAVVPLTAFGLLVSGLGTASAAAPAAAPTVPVAASASSSSSGYGWGNVEIVGGGFIPGIIFNESEQDLVYSRTDIGGAYRLDQATQRWIPLLDHLGWDDWSHTGVLSLATDAVDPDRLYVAVGTYTNGWDPNNGAILRSDDRGETWQKTDLPFKVGGNMPGRGMGERLQIDPNNNAIIYFGASSGNGLWKSTDYGVTWAQVTQFPNVGNYVQDASSAEFGGYLADNQGVVWVTFDPSTGANGSTTQSIYVGVADKDNNVYRSTDGGATWSRVAGQPTGFLAHKGVLDDAGKQLYISTSDTGGPYDGGAGQVWRLDIASGTWTDISPVKTSSSDLFYGYSGLTVDRNDPDTIMAVSQVAWWPDIIIFRSTDRGQTWTRIWDWAGYPERTRNYTLDISGAPWLTFGKQPNGAEPSPKLGWMTESFEIDPFDSDRFYYGTGATMFGGTNLTDWDEGKKINISVKAQGIEETAVLDLIAPPAGAELISGLGDIGGFVHTDITKVPTLMYTQPYHGAVHSLDYAELSPTTIVRVGQGVDGAVDSHIGVSTSGGTSWFAGQEPSGVTGAGTVAVNANGSRILWSPVGTGVHVSTTLGSSWAASTGIPAGARVESDRVDPNVFYGYAAGRFYVSTNGGASFTASAAAGLPADGNVRFAAVPGHAGDVWLAGGMTDKTYGMWHSTDSGATFTRVAAVDEGDAIGFGKAAPGATYPTIFTSSKIDGVRGIFRSDDAGSTWNRINDDAHQWAWTGSAITGDPDVYGRVYIGTNGRGIIVGNSGGTVTPPVDTTAPSVPAGLTAGTTTTSTIPLTWTASTDNVAVTGYDIYRGATLVGSSTGTSYTATGLTDGTSYTFTVRAKDGAGNVSTASAPVTATTKVAPDTVSPSVPTNLVAGTTTTTTVPLSWTASTDNVAVTGYDVYQGSTKIATAASTSWTATGLTASTSYTFTVRAKDGAGNVSAASAPVTATTKTAVVVDTTAPTVPTNLAAGTTTTATVPLTWTASTDNVAVTGYDVYRGGTLIGSSIGTSYTATGLADGTSYSFTVRAKDAAGNISAHSASVTATTKTAVVADTTAPTVPTNLAAGTTTTSAVPLTWTASTDNVAVTGYDVYQGGTKIGSSTGTSYTVTGLAADTSYTFTVRAKDAAGNVSAASVPATAKTQANPVTPAGSCQVRYTTNDWNTGFTANVKIKNTGTTTITGWSLGFAFPAGQSVSAGWSAIYTANGATQTVTNQSWNGTIAAGQTVEIGFNGNHNGTNTHPASFTLNGATCS